MKLCKKIIAVMAAFVMATSFFACDNKEDVKIVTPSPKPINTQANESATPIGQTSGAEIENATDNNKTESSQNGNTEADTTNKPEYTNQESKEPSQTPINGIEETKRPSDKNGSESFLPEDSFTESDSSNSEAPNSSTPQKNEGDNEQNTSTPSKSPEATNKTDKDVPIYTTQPGAIELPRLPLK